MFYICFLLILQLHKYTYTLTAEHDIAALAKALLDRVEVKLLPSRELHGRLAIWVRLSDTVLSLIVQC